MQHLPVHPFLRHPRTGQPLVAVGIVNGRPVWPIMGASAPAGEGQGQQGGQQGSANGGQTGSDQGGTGQQGTQQTGQTSGQQQGQATDQQQGEPQDVSSLPKWAQDLIKTVRGEAASHRTKAGQLEKASQQQLDTIAKALGLKPADADPAKLAEELDKTKGKARDSEVRLAVYQAAGRKGVEADPTALLDSRSFMASLADLDPSAADFGTKVETAIKAAAKENPKLKAGPAAAVQSGGEFTGGTGAGAPVTEEQLAKMTPAEVAKAYTDGKLKHLM